MTSRLSFRIEVIPSGAAALIPEVDGVSLIELVTAHESVGGNSPDSVYGGIVPEYFNYGDLARYYLGIEAEQWPRPGEAWLLGCECGEVGCWPLEVRVTITDQFVTWSHFRQPHRPRRDYSTFGPFQFDRQQYESAVTDCVGSLWSEGSAGGS